MIELMAMPCVGLKYLLLYWK